MNEPHTLGDAPIEERYRAKMAELARLLDEYFNNHKRGADRDTGFPFGDDPKGRANFISNGADRRDVVTLFREIARFEGQPEMEGRA